MDANEIVVWTKRAFRRLISSDFQKVKATKKEREQLEAAPEPVKTPLAQDYAVWRRSLLWIAGVALVLLALLEVATFRTMKDYLGESELAQAAGSDNLDTLDGIFGFLILPVLVGGILSLVAAVKWRNVRASRRLARFGFLVMFVTPFAMAALPANEMLDFEHLREDVRPLAAQGLGVVVGGRLFALIGPRAIALFPGIIRSAMALKTLVPQSPMPGWATTFVAPLYAIFLLVVFALVNQIQGNFLLVGGLLCLMAAPLVYLRRSKDVLRPHSAEEVSAVIGRLRRQAGFITFAGVALFLVFFIDVGMKFGDILTFAVSIVGNIVLLTVVGADFLLALIHRGHDQSKALVGSKLDTELEDRFTQLEGVGFTDFGTAEKEAEEVKAPQEEKEKKAEKEKK